MNIIDRLINITNDILIKLNITVRVKKVSEIDCKVIVKIYETLFKTEIDKENSKSDRSNDVVIIKKLLSLLSHNILHVTLNHIVAEKVVEGDRVALTYLLEIFQGLVECFKSSNKEKQSVLSSMNDIDENAQRLRRKIKETDMQTDNLANIINCGMEIHTTREKYLEKKIKELMIGNHGEKCPSLMEYVKENEDRVILIKDQYSQKPPTPRSNQKVYMIPRHKSNFDNKSLLHDNITELSNIKGRITLDDDLTKVTGHNDQMTEGSVDLSQGSNETYVVTSRTMDDKDVIDIDHDTKVKEAWTDVNKDLIHDGYENEFLEMLLREEENLCRTKQKGSNNLKDIKQNMSAFDQLRSGLRNNTTLPPKKKVTPRPCGGGLVKPIIKHIGHGSDCESNVTFSSHNTSRSNSASVGKDNDGEMMVRLLKEFPGLNISEQSLRQMWAQASRQATNLRRIQQEFVSRVGPGEQKVEDARRRQQLLFKMLRKEALQQARFRQQVEERESQFSLKANKAKQRQQSAKVMRYYGEFSQQMRSRMLQKQAKEEQVFRSTFKAALKLQKERIIDLQRYAKEKKNEKCVRHQKELESVENYYRDRFSMLADCLHEERRKLNLQDKSQEQAIHKQKNEMRKYLEEEIKLLQESMIRSQHETYFRQLDSEDLITSMYHE